MVHHREQVLDTLQKALLDLQRRKCKECILVSMVVHNLLEQSSLKSKYQITCKECELPVQQLFLKDGKCEFSQLVSCL
jgi:hypothetical protein